MTLSIKVRGSLSTVQSTKFGLNVDEEVFLRPLAMAGVLLPPGVSGLALPDVLGAISTENTNQ